MRSIVFYGERQRSGRGAAAPSACIAWLCAGHARLLAGALRERTTSEGMRQSIPAGGVRVNGQVRSRRVDDKGKRKATVSLQRERRGSRTRKHGPTVQGRSRQGAGPADMRRYAWGRGCNTFRSPVVIDARRRSDGYVWKAARITPGDPRRVPQGTEPVARQADRAVEVSRGHSRRWTGKASEALQAERRSNR